MFWRGKKTFFDYKNKINHSLKNRIFPRGLTHAFGRKMQFLFLFVFGQKTIYKSGLKMFQIKKKQTFFDYKNKLFPSLKNCIFPKGVTNAFGQKWHFFLYLCSVKTRLEIVLTDFVDEKETYFDY